MNKSVKNTAELSAELNTLRANNQKQFKTVAEWLEFNQNRAKQYARIFSDMEKACKIEFK